HRLLLPLPAEVAALESAVAGGDRVALDQHVFALARAAVEHEHLALGADVVAHDFAAGGGLRAGLPDGDVPGIVQLVAHHHGARGVDDVQAFVGPADHVVSAGPVLAAELDPHGHAPAAFL